MEFRKIAVSAEGKGLEAQVDSRFGRASYFIIYDLADETFEAVKNPAAFEPHGAGIAAANFLLEKGVQGVITGHCGPKAFTVLRNAGVKVFSFSGGTVAEALSEFKAGRLAPLNNFSHGGGHGLGRGKGAF